MMIFTIALLLFSLNSVLSLLLLGSKTDSDTEIELRDILGKIVNPDQLKNMNRKIISHLDSLGKKQNLSNHEKIFRSKTLI